MKDNDKLYDYFIKELYKKYPQKAQLTKALMDLLFIEREAVYRRLRKEVLFSVHEMLKIASEWNISLDEIISYTSNYISFKIDLLNYINPSEEELDIIQSVVQFYESLKGLPNVEYMEITNKIPRSLTTGFMQIYRYVMLKWMYQYGDETSILPFSQINPSEKWLQLTSDYYLAAKNVANVSYIWDHMLFNYLVCDIRYFCSIQLITDEEKELIKKDAHALLDYMLQVATNGCFPETKTKVSLYISQVNIGTSYSYFCSDDIKMSRIHAFTKHEIYTTSSEMTATFKNWMQSKKRSSVQISEVDEKGRIEYFTKQHELIDSL